MTVSEPSQVIQPSIPDCGQGNEQSAPQLSPAWPQNLHPRTLDLVQRFAVALAQKLRLAEEKYGFGDGWADDNWEQECRAHFLSHIEKGDPRDVAAYCAFMWHHGWVTSQPNLREVECDVCGGDCASANPPVYDCPSKSVAETRRNVPENDRLVSGASSDPFSSTRKDERA